MFHAYRKMKAAIRSDDAWAALKFTHPVAGRTYHRNYGTLAESAVHRWRNAGK
jgi:hypothetical protein